MRKLAMAGAMGVGVVLAGCSGRGETIQTPTPASEPTTTAEGINLAQPAADPEPTTTIPEPTTTTEPEPEPVVTVPPVPRQTVPPATSPPPTAEYLQPEATIETGAWAIPTYIVMCESGGDWYAHNPSGASGPYQIMPMHFGGELAMNQSRAAQHAKAAELWNGGKGKSHWSACL